MNSLDPVLSDFSQRYPHKKYSPGRTVVYQGEIPRSGYFLHDGIVRVYSLDSEGNENNVSFIDNGDIFPLEFIFEKSNASLYYYEAITPCDIAIVPLDELHRERHASPELNNVLLEEIVTQCVGGTIHIHALEQISAREKMLRILHYLVLRFGHKVSDDKWVIDLRLKQHDIASMIGVTRETAATELGKLKKQGTIEYSSFTYSVKMDVVSRLVGNEEWALLAAGAE